MPTTVDTCMAGEPSAGDADNYVSNIFSEFLTLPEEVSTKRDICKRCSRPSSVCICTCFPVTPIPIQTRIIILQHPHEESRSLATVPLLQQCIPTDRLSIIRGKRFGPEKSELLNKALQSRSTIILYPGKCATDISTLPQKPIGICDDGAVIAIDGTWSQSKGLYSQNPQLHDSMQVQLNITSESEYVIRTQPTKTSLSTLECIAHTLAWLENDKSIIEVLLKPLRALCHYQLEYGAVKHQSKDDPNYITRWEMKAKLKEEANRRNCTGTLHDDGTLQVTENS